MNRPSIVVGAMVVFGALILLVLSRQAPPLLAEHEPGADVETEPEAPAAALPPVPVKLEKPEPPPPPKRPAAPAFQPATLAAPAAPRAEPTPGLPPPGDSPTPPALSGPVDELKQRYETDPRDSGAHQLEEFIRRTFRQNDIPEGLFESALCRESVCKVVLRWAPDRHTGYLTGVIRLLDSFENPVAFDPVGEQGGSGETNVELYFRRKQTE